VFFFFFQAEDGIRDFHVTGVQTCALPIFQEEGFIYHSEVCIWKDPVVAMQRTKALGLLHKTIRKDSSMSRQGIPDYLVTMRKPRSEERRVGKECRSGMSPDVEKKS